MMSRPNSNAGDGRKVCAAGTSGWLIVGAGTTACESIAAAAPRDSSTAGAASRFPGAQDQTTQDTTAVANAVQTTARRGCDHDFRGGASAASSSVAMIHRDVS